MQNNINPQTAAGHGYIVVPKIMLTDYINHENGHEGDIEAFLKLLIKVNYSDTQYTDYHNNAILCKRGESLHSYRSWSDIFHWPVCRTYRFIRELKSKGIIEVIPHADTDALHIRVIDYESWITIPSPKSKDSTKEAVNEQFQIFWNEYHSVTQLPKQNIAKAKREWKKLGKKEQKLAIANIEEYYFHQTNFKYLLQAGSYLANKAFLNEY